MGGLNNRSYGELQVILGPMFSGKTSELIRRVQRYNLAGFKCLVVRYTQENRYTTDSINTHDGTQLAAVHTCNLMDICHLADDPTVIGIDEGHFFPDIVEFCGTQSDKGKKVVVAALDGTYEREAFGRILGLIPFAEEVVKLNSICMSCSADAPFTKRITKGNVIEYMSVCQDCYVREPTIAQSPFKRLKPPLNILPFNNEA